MRPSIVQKGAFGEFSGLGCTKPHLAPCLKTTLQNNLLQCGSAVSLDLQHIFSGIGGRTEEANHNGSVNQVPIGVIDG